MKKFIYSACVAALMLQSCQNSNFQADEVTKEAPSRKEIDAQVWKSMDNTGKFDWSSASNDMIWSALNLSDNVLSVGFKPANSPTNISTTIDQIDITRGEWAEAKNQVLALILREERKLNPTLRLDQLEVFQENTLPVVNVLVKNYNTVATLRSSALIRYTEPMGYQPNPRTPIAKSSSGCDGNPSESGLVAGSDYTNITPNAKASWNHPLHNIPSAWLQSTGAGIGVMIIDTGMSDAQENFGSQFNQGASAGRTIQKLVTLPRATFLGIPTGPVETSNDGCGHGTSMAGALAAPRGTDGNSAGIAYNCNLVTVRASQDVFLDASREIKGVSDAYILAGNRTDIRITSMSLGTIISSSQITDAINYANNKGKMIFCAGGTSFGWSSGFVGVIFPAWLPQVNAVTGIKETFTKCDVCHEGSEIDFVVHMEKNSNGRHVLTTANSTDNPATVGGSSVATASCAGMAALIWSKYPTWTRAQVLSRMQSSANYFPTRHSKFGWGRINMATALQ
jgi:subtilisin family serine protease